MITRRIDMNGYFVEDVLSVAPDTFHIDTQIPDGMLRPRWNGKEWMDDPTAEQKAEAKERNIQRKKQAVQTDYEASMQALVAKYPPIERETFAQKEREARAYLQTHNTDDAQMLYAIAGDDIEALAQKVLAKAQQLATAAGQIERERNEALAALQA